MFQRSKYQFMFTLVIASVFCASLIAASDDSMFADEDTIALWLFDEVNYPYTTLTDASINEYDLRLQAGGKLVTGKFGNALQVSHGDGHALGYAGFKGSVPLDVMRDKDGKPSGLYSPTIAPKEILDALSQGDWTVEMWLKLDGRANGTLLDIGNAYDPGVTMNLLGESLEIVNTYAGVKAVCPIKKAFLTNGKWHHIALTYSSKDNSFGCFLDGKSQAAPKVSKAAKQPVPEVIMPVDLETAPEGFTKDSTLDWRRQNRFNIAVGHDRKGNYDIPSEIDELRISKVIRYSKNFRKPKSFSYNYGPNAPKPTGANGPELLFAPDSPKGTVKLGDRKHLFIDEALVDSKENIKLTCNSPFDRKIVNFGPDKSQWRASVVDVDGKVYMYIPDGYGSKEGLTRLRISENGVDFTIPKLGAVEYKGSTDNEFVLVGTPHYGSFFADLNPDVHPQERFKMTGWIANRGIYVYMSPDGIHWRRNETCMLPLVSGGEAETYWDDQRGLYVDFIKRDASFKTEECPGGGRRASMFESPQILKAWPFKAMKTPYYEGWPMPAVTCEGPVIFANNENGQVYRTRAIKYPWAPDVYLSFVWRYEKDDQTRRVDLGVSRNGIDWMFFADVGQWYVQPDKWEEVLSLYGLVRMGDDIWQYFDYGGAHGGGDARTYARFTQRLDGFVSLDAGSDTGTVITRPLVFKGKKLELNINAKGSAKVALIDKKGNEIRGFTLADCDPIKADNIRQIVTWKGSSNVGKLAGKTVKLKFELTDAKLFAMQFINP